MKDEEIQVGIKMSDEQIEKAEAAGFLAWVKAGEKDGESYLWERRYVSDATVVHVVREIDKKLRKIPQIDRVWMSLSDWQAIIAEAGLVELTGIRIEIDTNLKPEEGHLKEAK